MKISAGDYPPRRPETPISFEQVKVGKYIRVVEYTPGHFDIRSQIQSRGSEEIIAQGKVVSNENGVIILEKGKGITTTLKKSDIKKNISIYYGRAPKRFEPFRGISDLFRPTPTR